MSAGNGSDWICPGHAGQGPRLSAKAVPIICVSPICSFPLHLYVHKGYAMHIHIYLFVYKYKPTLYARTQNINMMFQVVIICWEALTPKHGKQKT